MYSVRLSVCTDYCRQMRDELVGSYGTAGSWVRVVRTKYYCLVNALQVPVPRSKCRYPVYESICLKFMYALPALRDGGVPNLPAIARI